MTSIFNNYFNVSNWKLHSDSVEDEDNEEQEGDEEQEDVVEVVEDKEQEDTTKCSGANIVDFSCHKLSKILIWIAMAMSIICVCVFVFYSIYLIIIFNKKELRSVQRTTMPNSTVDFQRNKDFDASSFLNKAQLYSR